MAGCYVLCARCVRKRTCERSANVSAIPPKLDSNCKMEYHVHDMTIETVPARSLPHTPRKGDENLSFLFGRFFGYHTSNRCGGTYATRMLLVISYT